ncbi:MAG: hypothetical protein IT423_09980 [Pirellulaceae bacterium]|nr:hypothetical protein [Pirellulaceae bacterium]
MIRPLTIRHLLSVHIQPRWKIISRLMMMVLLTISLANSAALAQSTAPATNLAAQVLPYIPPDSMGCITFRVPLMAQDQSLRLVPWEIITASGLDEVGIDPLKLERIDVILSPSLGSPPQAACLVTSREKVGIAQLQSKLFQSMEPEKVGQREYYMLKEQRGMAATFLNDRQAMLGRPEHLNQVLAGKHAPGELTQKLSRIDPAGGHISAVFVLAPVREELKQMVSTLDQPDQADALILIDKITMVAARMQVSMELQVPMIFETASESDAQQVEASWNRLLKKLVQRMLANATSSDQLDSPTGKAIQAYVQRTVSEMDRVFKLTRNGARLMLRIDDSAMSIMNSFSIRQSFNPR